MPERGRDCAVGCRRQSAGGLGWAAGVATAAAGRHRLAEPSAHGWGVEVDDEEVVVGAAVRGGGRRGLRPSVRVGRLSSRGYRRDGGSPHAGSCSFARRVLCRSHGGVVCSGRRVNATSDGQHGGDSCSGCGCDWGDCGCGCGCGSDSARGERDDAGDGGAWDHWVRGGAPCVRCVRRRWVNATAGAW